ANRIALHAVEPLGIEEARLRRLLGDYAMSVSAGNRTSEALAEACDGQARRVVEEVPFSSARKWSALALDDDSMRGVYVLGAPELILPHLGLVAGLEPQIAALTGRGLRVVLLAYHPHLLPLHDPSDQPRLPDGLVPL